jgi:hypothetical protein
METLLDFSSHNFFALFLTARNSFLDKLDSFLVLEMLL